MTMPVTTTWIRHGKSESNETTSLAKKGTPHPREAALKNVHTSKRRLTLLGIEQARQAGIWIERDMQQRAAVLAGQTFQTRYFTSPYVRTMETALETGLRVKWRPDTRLCERNWGIVDHLTYDKQMRIFRKELRRRETDAFFWTPRDGESLLQVQGRLRQFLDMLNRQCSQCHAYISSHGETMWAGRSLHEYWMPEELAQRMLNEDKDLQNKMLNCRIVQYSRQKDDASAELDDHICRVRLINPMRPDDSTTNLDWQPVRRREFDPEELRAYVNQFKHYLRDDTV
ncbi:MAG: Phosphoglycerate mutase domain-containing protein [Candidatus Kaiserbacteria bacterium GW2011_GWB1_52_6]|uniref:Phosphoglycerate mutase domain-containing protein n=3 Tax=Candidatus Kaiseribacteriota TaxID=1752734 RepID=A0A0G1XIF5_9BACT|nr:MAG: Phosphoglycerate mutase domain-containing protein [Candidatus Kaiserbacteria bacterium GW2011_GWA2_52_12]KKW26526.1 MAG: Phosphoglycerate mutase domain-containing protein [Candidatus Kaiserbacteria bacterium GW2011_GWB1_52_6]KKW30731.1 MAG: Phosphoglycerate mutase domain-containing protein [Candidatus Kaiserbacteria bacterium GW2011_GWC2_52_8b]